MTVILGNSGNVLLRRANSITWDETISPDDLTLNLNRVGTERATDNILLGDRIVFETDDPRGLLFLPPTYWSSGQVENSAAPYVHVNAAGGLRLFRTFAEALENNRSNEIILQPFTGEPLQARLTVRDTVYNSLGNVESYTFNSDRSSIDITVLGDDFKAQYEAGLLSGSGTLNCFFQHTRIPSNRFDYELPIVLMQLLQRIDLGSGFAANLMITDKTFTGKQNAFYQINGVITRSGVDVRAGDLIKVAIDFVTTGEYKLLIGDPLGYILKEDDFYIEKEKGLGFLLKEETD